MLSTCNSKEVLESLTQRKYKCLNSRADPPSVQTSQNLLTVYTAVKANVTEEIALYPKSVSISKRK